MDKTISDVVDKDDINYDPRLEKPVPFVPITIAGEQLSSEINNQFPLGVPSFFNKPAPIGQTITGNVIPGASLLKENKGKPGWWETAANTFYNYNLELQTGKFLYDSIAPNPLHEEIPEGWNAMNPDALEEFPMKYWPHISSALGPKDQAARQQKVREQIEKDEYIESGSFTAKLAGGAAGAIISPMTIFGLPAITTLKYAGVAQNVLMNMARTAPAIALDSFARNTMMEANRIGGTLEDVATSTLVDTAFGTSLIGLGAGIASGSKNLNLWNTRKAASLVIARGIGISEEVTKDGVLTGKRIAFPLPGSSANAAEVDFAQAWVNESMSKSGLFAIPGIGSAIEKGIMTPLGIKAFESPAITAAKSPYMAVKKWYNGIAGSPFITKDVEQGIAAPDSAQIIADQFSSQALNFRQLYKAQFHEANGISGSNPGSALKNMRQIITNNRQITTDKFDIEVHNIMEIEGYKSDWPQAHVVADAVHDLFNHVNEINAQQTGRPLFRDPRTAWKFLPHNKKMNRLRQREDEYNNITYDALLAQDKRIVELTTPINNSQARINELKQAIKSKTTTGVTVPELVDLNSQLRAAKGLLEKQNIELENHLLNNEDDHILLEDRVLLTQDDRSKLRALLEPLKKAGETVDKHEQELSVLNNRIEESKLELDKQQNAKKYEKNKVAQDELSNRLLKAKLENDIHLASIKEEIVNLKESHAKIIEDFSSESESLLTKKKSTKEKIKNALEQFGVTNDKKLTKELNDINEQIKKLSEQKKSSKLTMAADKEKLLNKLSNKKEAIKAQANEFKKEKIKLKEVTKKVEKNTFTKEYLTDEIKDIAHAISLEENRLKIATEERDKIKFKLDEDAYSGKVKEHFYENDGYKIKFRDPEEPVKLRKAYENDRARWQQVHAWYESETNTSPQDLIQQVIGGMPETSGMPNNFKSRTKMIPSNVYTEAGFYDDLTKTVTAYMQTVGRNYGFKAVFPELANVKDFEGVFRALKQEHDAINAKILEKPVSKERDKEKEKSDKAFSNAKKFMSDTYKTYMGSYNAHENPKLRAAVSIAKSITSAEKLGGTLAYQIADMGGIIMKSGLMPFFRNGLVPLLKTMNGHIKGENSEAWINNAGYVGLGVNTEISVLGNRMFNSSAMDTAPVSSFLDNAVSGANIASHYAGNFFGINSIANINERLAASTVQASIMDAAFKFRAGTITQLDKQNMAQIGIQIEEVAESFIKNFEESGGWKQGKNGYQSLYWKWADTEAVTRMANSVRRGVQDSIINSSKYASPYWAQSPLLSMVFMFHGWAYNAFNRYAVPLMQRPDAQHMIGLTSIVGLSMMAEPLLNMSNGKPAYEDDKTLLDSAMRALDYSGFLGPTWDLLANINKATGQSLFQDTAQKRANYKGVGAMMGPVIGMGWDMAQLTGHIRKGDLTQGDAKQIAHMIPLLNHILNRNAVNDFVKLSGLPERRADAEPWSIWQK